METAEQPENYEKVYTVTVGPMNQEVSFGISGDQEPPQKIRFFNKSTSIAVFSFDKKTDSYVKLTKDELERFDRGLKTGECRHLETVGRDNYDERGHKTLVKLQKKLKEKKNNQSHCSYCQEYGGVFNIPMPVEPTSEEIGDEGQVNMDTLKLSKPEVIAVSSTSIKISWEESVTNNEQLENCAFELHMSKSKNSSFSSIYRGTDQTFTMVDLLPGTKYYFRVCSIKDSLQGPFSPHAFAVTDATSPSTPDTPYISNKTKTSFVLKWTTKSDNGSPITLYVLQCNEGRDKGSFQTIFQGLQKQYKFSHKLAPMKSCSFRVKAINKIGESDFSPELVFTASAGVPSTPDPPTLVKPAANSLHLSWKRPNENGAEITEYALQMEDHNKGYGFLSVYRGNELKCVVDGLKRNTKYNFRLSAVNNQGDSKWSDVIAFLTISQAPAGISAPVLDGKVHTKSFAVIWDPPADDGGSEIINYVLQIDDGKGGSFQDAYVGLDINYKFQNLFPGHSYKVRVSCASSSFQSPWSDVTYIKTLPVIPHAPSAPRPSKQNKLQPYTIGLIWDPPTNNGGANITNYNVQMKIINAEGEFQHIYLGPKNNCCASELIPNSKYSFRVRAQNTAGDSKFSDVSVLCTDPGPPDVIDFLEVFVKSSNTLKVTWKTPKDNGTPVTGYNLAWAKSSTGPFEKVYSVDNNCEIKKNLSPSTVYYFKVQALSEAGCSNWNDVVSCKTLAAPPRQVTHLKAVDQSSTSLTLQWQVPDGSGSSITSYNIDIIGYKIITFVPDHEVEKNISDKDPSTLQCKLSDLKSHEQYRFRVQAVNKSGCGPFSSVVSATTATVPPKPPVLEMTNTSYQSVKLHWKCNGVRSETSDQLHYELQMREKDSSSFVTVFKGPSNCHKVNKLAEQTTYIFRVRAANEAGHSPYSDIFICQTGVQPPQPVKIKEHHYLNMALTLTWNEVRPVHPSDRMKYILEWQRKGFTEMEQLYEGGTTTFTCNNFTPKQSYSFRVCAVRILPDGRRIQSPFSALFLFTAPPKTDENVRALASKIDSNKEESPATQFTERNLAVFAFIGFGFLVLIMALLIAFFQPDP